MLRVQKKDLGQFGEPELEALIHSRGWQSVLPHVLDDRQLLLMADQLRDLLSGQGWDTARGPGSAALPITLLLLSKAGAPGQGPDLNVEMTTLHEVMTLLSVTVDREIVSRTLQRRDDAAGSDLMQGLKELVRYSQAPAKAPCLA
jgi:hypothetical protein